MKLKEFIKKLRRIEKERGKDLEVVMADNIPVVSPVFSDRYDTGEKVVITDEE